MKKIIPFITFCVAGLAIAPCLNAAAEQTRTYQVEQTVRLSEIPKGAGHVKWWISIPDDDRFQEVLDLKVSNAPGDWKVVREPDRGNRFILVEVDNPQGETLSVSVQFTLRRQPVFVAIDPALVGPITESHRKLFANELDPNAPHMEVNGAIVKMALAACGNETNVAIQARKLLDAVADYANHYSTDPTVPTCSIGDAGSCMEKGGGCCTDLHSLFISLARSRSIPARLQMGYRLREQNGGKEVDPGYRCWAEYFVPGYGWVPTDIVEADDPKGLGRDRWFTGLTERRLWLNSGRDFLLPGRSADAPRASTMVTGFAEIDGVEARTLPDEAAGIPSQFSRTVRYVELDSHSG